MTAELRVCDRCGHRAPAGEVRSKLVEYENPPDVEVEIPASHRDGAVGIRRRVPGRYAAEFRCVDTVACERRARKSAGGPPPDVPPAVKEEARGVTRVESDDAPASIAPAPTEPQPDIAATLHEEGPSWLAG